MSTEMSLEILRGLCAERGLSQGGNKKALVQRLTDDANGVPRKKPGRPPLSTSEKASNVMAKFGFKTRDDTQSAHTAVTSALAGYAASSKKSKKPAGIMPTVHVTSTKNAQDKQTYMAMQYATLAAEGWRDPAQMQQEAEDRWKKKQGLAIIQSNKKNAMPKPTKTIAKKPLPKKTLSEDEFNKDEFVDWMMERMIEKRVPKTLIRPLIEAYGGERLPKAANVKTLVTELFNQIANETDSEEDEDEDEDEEEDEEAQDDDDEDEDDDEDDDEEDDN